jgi:AraC-like DNA-binding protein
MFQQLYEPDPALKGFVNNIMVHQLTRNVGENPGSFSIPPLPEQALIFYVRDPADALTIAKETKQTLPAALLMGPQLNRHTITPGRDHLMVKVGFQPGGLYRFLGIPMGELLGQDAFDGVELLGSEINQVSDQLREAACYMEMKKIVERFLLKHVHRLKQALPIDQVLPLLIRQGGLLKIEQLASSACLSTRQFERLFGQRIGLPPKHFSRLVRFSHAWILKQQRPHLPWIQIAYECGYFDQMHLIRDFHEFAGVNPSTIEGELLNSQVQFFTRLFC